MHGTVFYETSKEKSVDTVNMSGINIIRDFTSINFNDMYDHIMATFVYRLGTVINHCADIELC